MANLYLIFQHVNDDYDTFDSAVVCARDEVSARLIHPRGIWGTYPANWHLDEDAPGEWTRVCNVNVRYLGHAAPGIEPGVICASFNAG